MSASKVEAVLRELDRIKSTVDDACRKLRMEPATNRLFYSEFGGYVSPEFMLFKTAYHRELLNTLLYKIPEPPEELRTARAARPTGKPGSRPEPVEPEVM